MKFVDIHSHLIFGVDDGSQSLEQSLKEITSAKEFGVKHIICTPHSCHGDEKKIKLINENFNILKKEANKLGVNLYLGNEVLYSSKMLNLLKEKRLMGLNDTKYVLFEFKRSENMPEEGIITIIEDLVDHGYKPVLAHPELYTNHLNIESITKFKDAGAMLQICLTSIFRKNNKYKSYKIAKKMLKNKLVDVVASDNHCTDKRNYSQLQKAYDKVSKKYGERYAEIIFYENPVSIGGIIDEQSN